MPISLDRVSGVPLEGTHICKVARAEERASRESGQPCVYVTLQVQEPEEDKGKEVLLTLSQVEAARFKTEQFLDAIEVPRKGTMEVSQFVGKMLRATIRHKEWNGNVTADVQAMFPKGSTNNPEIKHIQPPAGSLPVQTGVKANPFKK